ncbi:non-ribosomal peptide synthetase [Streptomyces sp. 5-10]|uniref:non-ribosomal peptide synthetase n=1 Tax=Streptomyces sp. 5-10 TaxID=878925 RepID=UPI001CC28ED9|nr:non-ribosomal peptide synthetase [Streptomyces sp. 5-10]
MGPGGEPVDILALCLGMPPAAYAPGTTRTALRQATEYLTYGDLAARVQDRSASLRAQGLGPGALVPLSTTRSVETIVELLSLLAVEAAFVPLEDGAEGGPGTRQVRNGARTLPSDAAYVMTTSGSAGEPKETVVTRTGLRHVFGSLRTVLGPHIPPGLRWSQFHPLTFGYSMCEILGSLAMGGELAVIARERPLTCAGLRDSLEDHGAHQVLCLTPSELTLLTHRLRESGADAPGYVVLSGEPAHRTQLADFFALPGAGRTYMVNTYAATETAGQVTISRITAENVEATMNGYVGRPLPGVRVTLHDPAGVAIPRTDTKATGEIWVSGPTVAAGYLHEEQTAARFTPPGPVGGVFRTGDVGRWADDGGLYVVGRGGRRVKVAGRWVALDAVERELLAAGDVAEVAAVPGTLALDGIAPQECLTVVAVPAGRDSRVAERVRLRTVATLGAPITLRLHLCEELPRLPNGKVDMGRLPRPGTVRPAPGRDVAALVRSVWEEILGEGIHPTTNLFEAGVDSLGVVTAAARLSQVLKRTVTVAELLDAPRIQAQTTRLSHERWEGAHTRPAAPRTAPASAATDPPPDKRERRRVARAAQRGRQQGRQGPTSGQGGNQ